MTQKSVQIWAHRGASGYAPENTLEAFQLAVEQNADGVELDVHLSKEGILVVAHDENISRVSNGKGYIKNMTLKELKSYSFNKTHPEYQKATLPTLQEVYQLLKPTGMTINVEVKTGIFRYEGIESKLLDLARKEGVEQQVFYSSFNHYSLTDLKKINPDCKIGLLYQDIFLDIPAYAEKVNADALHPMQEIVKMMPNYMQDCRQHGLKVHPWTVNSKSDLADMYRLGVDAVITNYPDRAREILKSSFQR